MGLKITFAKNEDIQGILNVFNELSINNRIKLNENLSENGFLVYPITKNDLEGIIKNKKNILLVAKHNTKIIGYALAYDIFEWMKLKPTWENKLKLNKLYSTKLFNKNMVYFRQVGRLSGYKGVGIKLEERLFEIIKERGYHRIIAEIAQYPKNIISQKVHKARGFIKVGTIEYGDSIIWGVYIKDI